MHGFLCLTCACFLHAFWGKDRRKRRFFRLCPKQPIHFKCCRSSYIHLEKRSIVLCRLRPGKLGNFLKTNGIHVTFFLSSMSWHRKNWSHILEPSNVLRSTELWDCPCMPYIYIYISMHELNLKLHACVLSRLYDGISKPLATLEKESKSLIEMQSKAVGGTPTRWLQTCMANWVGWYHVRVCPSFPDY